MIEPLSDEGLSHMRYWSEHYDAPFPYGAVCSMIARLDTAEAERNRLRDVELPMWVRETLDGNDYIATLEAELDALKAALNQEGHVLVVNAAGWALEHPVPCRTTPGGMASCPVHRAAEWSESETCWWALGRYKVAVGPTGYLSVES